MDNNKICWDVEVHSYLLEDGRYYRPDFFIYENDILKEVVEIKAKYLDKSFVRIDKFHQFQKEYCHISSKILYKEDIFGKLEIRYKKNIEEWKKIRKKNENTD